MRVEDILEIDFFMKHPEVFWSWAKDNWYNMHSFRPNIVHRVLVKMEEKGLLSEGIFTQNIDGLHQAAGSKRVYELHGSVHRNYCTRCGAFYDLSYILQNADENGIPRCKEKGCGGIIKPDVVLYEEGLDQRTIEGALRAIREADMLIVGGTSLAVYPAAGLIQYYRGNKLVLINKTPTQQDDAADLLIHAGLGEVLTAAVNPDRKE